MEFQQYIVVSSDKASVSTCLSLLCHPSRAAKVPWNRLRKECLNFFSQISLRFKTNSFLFSFLFSHSHTKQYIRTNTLSHTFVFHLLLSLSLPLSLSLSLTHNHIFNTKQRYCFASLAIHTSQGLKFKGILFPNKISLCFSDYFFSTMAKECWCGRVDKGKHFLVFFSLKNFVSSSLVGQKSFHVCGVFPGHFNRPICFKILTLSWPR